MKRVKKDYKNKRLHYITFVSIFMLSILILTIGFSALSTNLSISALATIRVKKDIRITDIMTSASASSAASNWEDYNVSNINSSISLPNASSTVSYDVQVTNIGTKEMGILSITGLPSNLTYTISNYNLKDKLCDDNNSSKCNLGSVTTLHITIGYANNGYDANNTDYNLSLDFVFKEAFSVSYVGFSSISGLPSTILEDETKTITFNNTTGIPYDVRVTNATGSYSNPALTISNASGNVVVTRYYAVTYTGFTGSTAGLINKIPSTGGTISFNTETGLPEMVTVTGATSSYDLNSHMLTLSNVISNVNVHMENDGIVEIVSITQSDVSNVTENNSPTIANHGQNITFDLGVTVDETNSDEDFYITYAIVINNDSVHEQKVLATNFTPNIVGSGNLPNVSYSIKDANGNEVLNTVIAPKTSETYYLTIVIEPQEQGSWGVEGETSVDTVVNGTVSGEISGSSQGDLTGTNTLAHFTATVKNSFEASKSFTFVIDDARFQLTDSSGTAISSMTIGANATGTYDFYVKNLNGNNYMSSPVDLNIKLNYDNNSADVGTVSLAVDIDPSLTDNTPPTITSATAAITNTERVITVSFAGTDDNKISHYYIETYLSDASGNGTKVGDTAIVDGAANGATVTYNATVPNDDAYYFFKIYADDPTPNVASASDIADCSTSAGYCMKTANQKFKWNFKITLVLTNANSNTGTVTSTSGNTKTYEFNAFYNTTASATLSGASNDFNQPSNIANATITYPNGTTSTLPSGNSTRTAYQYNNSSGRLNMYHVIGDIRIQATGAEAGGTCLAEGTKVLMADFSYKNIEDVKYDDLLAVWDYENGEVTYEYPLWIESEHVGGLVTRVTFEDKSYIDFVGDHAIYSTDANMFVSVLDNKSFKVGTHVAKLDNNKLVKTTVTKIERLNKKAKYYFVGSTTYYNIFANDILTTDRHLEISNLYGFDEIGVWPQSKKEFLSNENNLLDYSYFKDILPYYLYDGFRVREAGYLANMGMVKLTDFKEFIKEFIINQDMISPPITMNNERYWMVTTSEDYVTDKNKSSYLRKEGSIYTLPKSNNKYFKGWYNTSDNKIYKPGDKINVSHGLHFKALYEQNGVYKIPNSLPFSYK